MAEMTVTDANGRKLVLRDLSILEQARLYRAMGAAQANNEPYGNLATVAAMVREIDGTPRPFPTNELNIDGAIGTVGDVGFAAITMALNEKRIAAQAELDNQAAPQSPLAASASSSASDLSAKP